MARPFTRRRLVGGLVVLLTAGALGGAVAMRLANKAASNQRPPQVALQFAAQDLVRVDWAPINRWLPVSGTLTPERQATVKSKVAGEVREIGVREGEAVRAGQVIARIDSADLEARVAERIGALESARAQLALATKTQAMNVKLMKEKFISQNAFDASESSFDVAQGNLKSAEAQLKLAQNALGDAIVRAPLAGIVAKRHAQAGEKVPIDGPLVTIVDLGDLELQALVPAIDVPELAIGMPVELAVDGFGERRFTGRIGRINPSTEPGTRAIVVYVALANRDALLRAGMFATGRIALAPGRSAPTLPLAAVRTEGGQSYVWAITEGKLVRRTVLLGRRDDETGRVEVKTQLPADLPILAAKFDNLKEGMAAVVKTPGGKGKASEEVSTREHTKRVAL